MNDPWGARARTPTRRFRRAAGEAHLAACVHCISPDPFEAAVLDGLTRRLRRITAPPELLQPIPRSLGRDPGRGTR